MVSVGENVMSLRDVFITGLGVFLPNEPVSNDQIEAVLGPMEPTAARLRERVLCQSGIVSRHYALERGTGRLTHTNAQLTAEAVRDLLRKTSFPLDKMACLVCGTSAADQIIPAHGSMVHAELGGPPCEVVTTAGVCCSGMSALKYGYLSVATGQVANAVVTGSDLPSPSLTAQHFQPALERARRAGQRPAAPLEYAFLRWLLSDGAGALLLEPQPRSEGLSLRLDWLDLLSYASQAPVCMYFGRGRQADGTMTGYRTVADPEQLCQGYFFSLGQEVTLLQDYLPPLTRQALACVRERRRLHAEEIDWFLPHYSSARFRQPLYEGLADLGLEIPLERWFTNLATRGNTGAASPYIMLEELFFSGKLRPGQRLLCFVPESARMTFAFLHLTVV